MCAPGKHAKPLMALIATESTTCGLVFRAAGERPVTAPFTGAQVVLGVLRVREVRFHFPRVLEITLNTGERPRVHASNCLVHRGMSARPICREPKSLTPARSS